VVRGLSVAEIVGLTSSGDDRQTFAMKIDVSHFKEQGPIFGEVQAYVRRSHD
jgi:hypothetical protein